MYIKGYKKKKEKKLEPSAQEKEKETCPCCYNRMPKLWLVLWWKLEEIQETQVKKQNKTKCRHWTNYYIDIYRKLASYFNIRYIEVYRGRQKEVYRGIQKAGLLF